MKELEVLERLGNIHLGDGFHVNDEYKEELDVLRKALTPPTADEICEKLDKWVKENIEEALSRVRCDDVGFYYYDEDDYEEYIVQKTFDNCVAFGIHDLPPRLITLIGSFYEGGE